MLKAVIFYPLGALLRYSGMLFGTIASLLLTGTDSFSQCNNCQLHISPGAANPLCDSTKLDWAAWTSVTATVGSGTISSAVTISVTKPTGGLSTTPVMFNGGVFPPQYNVPVSTTAIRNDLAGVFTFCFNTPVRSPQIALASIGNGGLSVQVNTSECYEVIWSGLGMSYPNNTSFIGTEGYTIIQFPGIHTCISFDYLQSEAYCNLAFGMLDTNCQDLPPPTVCAGTSVTLTATGGTSYSWFPAAGLNTTSGSMVVATPSVTTQYYVADGACLDSILITVDPLPVVSVAGDTVLCAGESTTLTASGGGSYLWNTGSTVPAITVTPASSTPYQMIVTAPNGCKDSIQVNVTVNPLPIANAGADASVCSGNAVSLNASGGGSYLWSPSSGLSSSTVSNPSAGPAATTTYTMTVTDGNNCTASDDVMITVHPTPVAAFSVTTVCFNNPTLFNDLSTGGNIVQWSWSFGDGNIDSVQNPSHTYNTYGSFVALLIVTTAEGCQDTAGLQVNIHPLPSGSFSSTTVCVGAPTCFIDLSTIASGNLIAWSWNFDDPSTGTNNIANSQNPCHIFSDTGSYNVILTVTSNYNCQTTVILPAIVLPPPVAAFIAPNVCLNTPTLFTDASTGAANWFWQFGDGGTSNQQNPSHTYLGYGTYVVTLIVSSSGSCADTVLDTVMVNPVPVVNFMADTVCQGDSTSFSDLSFISAGSIAGWLWNFGDSTTSSLQHPSHVYASSGSYNVSLAVYSNNNCTTTVVQSIPVHPLPNVDFSFSPGPVSQLIDPVDFKDLTTGGAISWYWSFGDGDTSSQQFPTHLYQDTGAYVVMLIAANQYGCVDTAQYPLEIRDFVFYIPNTFTPNGDDKNELFFGVGLGITDYEFSIFDRWGNLVFYCKVNDLPQSLPCLWNGKVKGEGSELVQEDVYVYKVTFTNIFKVQYNLVGNVNVIR